MNYLNKLIVKARESRKGQTMTEYVLIIAAIAVAGYTAYVGLEGGINNIISNVTTTLKCCVKVAPNRVVGIKGARARRRGRAPRRVHPQS